MPNAYHRWVNQHASDEILPRAVRGHGVWIEDEHGKRYLDGSAGPALFSVGHSHPEVIDAMRAQLDMIEFGYSADFSSEPIDALSELVVAQAGGDLSRVSYVSGGSEANETAIKLAVQCQRARGFPERTKFIARRQSWHGYTIGALSLSGHVARRAPYEGMLLDVKHIGAVNAYRCPPGVTPETLAEHAAGELEAAILELGPENVAAFIFEPVVGAALGAAPAPDGYAKKVREICNKYGVLMISDEIMCGVGRCEAWLALEVDGVVPDILTIAKGLGGGYAPIGAAVYSEAVYRDIVEKDGRVATVHTYSGHTMACAAALAVQTVVARDNLAEKCRDDGLYLKKSLHERFGDHPNIGDIRGRGLFIGIELVADRETKEAFDPALQLASKIRSQAFQNGLICYPSSGTVDGVSGDHVLLSPPFTIMRSEIDTIVELLAQSIGSVLSAAKAG